MVSVDAAARGTCTGTTQLVNVNINVNVGRHWRRAFTSSHDNGTTFDPAHAARAYIQAALSAIFRSGDQCVHAQNWNLCGALTSDRAAKRGRQSQCLREPSHAALYAQSGDCGGWPQLNAAPQSPLKLPCGEVEQQAK
jgi:hypothetical protein